MSTGKVVTRRGSAARASGSLSPGGGLTESPGGGPGYPSSSSASRKDSNHLAPPAREVIKKASLESTGSQAEYFKPEQTIILFDWDDTLCPSHWIRGNRGSTSFFKPAPTDEKYQRPLRELQVHVEATLKLALKMG